MIDHKVTIGGEDVSADVISIKCQQQIVDNDSDPGKITIVLANRAQKYTNHWPPQVIPIRITLYNFVYGSAEERKAVGGAISVKSTETFPLAVGHLTDLVCNQEEATVTGECDLGHLADAIPNNTDKFQTTPKETLEYILSKHTDFPIALDWDPALKNDWVEREVYDPDTTFQDVCQDIAEQVGALYYLSESHFGVLRFRSPTTLSGAFNLDPYLINPEQTSSIMGYRNVVKVFGDIADGSIKTGMGASSPGTQPIISQYPHGYDEDSIADLGMLVAPVFRSTELKTQEDVNRKADELLNFYKMYKNALTKPIVAGIVPPLQSLVMYSVFSPVGDSESEKLRQMLQEEEDARAASDGRLPNAVAISEYVRGVVINRETVYSSEDGLVCTLTVSPGMLDMDTPITNEDIKEESGSGDGQHYPTGDEE